MCADTMEAFTDMFAQELKAGRYNESFTCAMTWCFQPSTSLHNRNFQLSEEELKNLSTSRQEWRKELKEGDKIDVNIVADDKDKVRGWVQGEIAAVNENNFSVIFPDLPKD